VRFARLGAVSGLSRLSAHRDARFAPRRQIHLGGAALDEVHAVDQPSESSSIYEMPTGTRSADDLGYQYAGST
jgi:hypothetical protein